MFDAAWFEVNREGKRMSDLARLVIAIDEAMPVLPSATWMPSQGLGTSSWGSCAGLPRQSG